jgi:hypothetical protein
MTAGTAAPHATAVARAARPATLGAGLNHCKVLWLAIRFPAPRAQVKVIAVGCLAANANQRVHVAPITFNPMVDLGLFRLPVPFLRVAAKRENKLCNATRTEALGELPCQIHWHGVYRPDQAVLGHAQPLCGSLYEFVQLGSRTGRLRLCAVATGWLASTVSRVKVQAQQLLCRAVLQATRFSQILVVGQHAPIAFIITECEHGLARRLKPALNLPQETGSA